MTGGQNKDVRRLTLKSLPVTKRINIEKDERTAFVQIKGENSMNTNGYVISTEGLSKSFGEVHALKSLDLRVPQKSIFAFLGPNGAGKTTTIKLLLGLIKPTSGGGRILGMDIVRDSVDIRARIGYLPQDARFYEHMSARQTLDYTARFFYAGPKAEIDRRVNEMIELVGLEGKADRPIKGFSGGETCSK